MDEADDELLANAMSRDSISKWRDGSSWEAVDVKARAEERVVDEELSFEVY